MTDNEIIETALMLVDEGKGVTFPVKGRSMLPFIVGSRESVLLVRPETPAVGDVVMAWVDGCRYVVHRIISIDGDQVTLMGDGNVAGVEHCRMHDVRARADYVIDSHGGRHYLYAPWRRMASRLWRSLLPLRRYLLAIHRLATTGHLRSRYVNM